MKRDRTNDPWEALQRVTDVAERFVNRSVRSKRLEAERQALLDAITQAQLALSLKRLSTSEHKPSPATNLTEHRKRPRASTERRTRTQ